MAAASSMSICVVCTGPTDEICHFGVQSCRACASFFHRSMKEKRKYTCRWGEQQPCLISNDDGLRNSCRACRLQKCLEVGMAVDKKRDRKYRLLARRNNSNANTSSLHQTQSTSSQIPFTQPALPSGSPLEHLSANFPATMRFEDSLRQYEHGLRALSVVEGICTDWSGAADDQMRLINKEEYLRAGKGSALLSYSLLCQHLPIMRQFPVEERIKMLKHFSKQFILLFRIHTTCKVFDSAESPYAVIVPGGIIDRTRLDELFVGMSDQQAERVRVSITERHFDFGKGLYFPLRVNQMEFAALVGILLWNSVEYTVSGRINYDEVNAQRDSLYGELFMLISERCTPVEAPIRFANLLEMLHKLAFHTLEVDEMYTMAKIFMDLPDFWDALNLPN